MKQIPFAIALGFAFVASTRGQEKPNPEVASYLKSALLQEGDMEKGKSLFNSNRISCSKCHSIDGTRSKAGPDLSALGEKYGRREIIESVLTPSVRIADGYETTILLLNDGKVVSGVIRTATDKSFELLGLNGDLIQVAVDDIEARRNSPVSIMPHGIHGSLSKLDFNDLIEFLVSLKQVESSARILLGMPEWIHPSTHPVQLTPIHKDSLHFDHPVWIGSFPGMDNQLLVVEHQNRKIWVLQKSCGDAKPVDHTSKRLFLDLGGAPPNEGRLAAIAPHPNFLVNRKYYLFDRMSLDGKMYVTIVEREVSLDRTSDSGHLDRLILKVPQTTGGHFGGWLEFGADGFLYVSFGDSGPQEDPNGNAQNRSLLLGKIIRIDVDRQEGSKAYSIPIDNPFVGVSDTLPEIWALGFRAPWRLSFDRITGDLWVGDVGQDRYEEISIIRRGENHGWNVFEGFETFSNRYRRPSEQYTPPIFAYARRYGPSVTGGFVYRADPHSPFYGKYIFGDYESKRIFALTQQDRKLVEVRQIGVSPQKIVSFGQGTAGEIYVVGYEGTIYEMDFSQASFE